MISYASGLVIAVVILVLVVAAAVLFFRALDRVEGFSPQDKFSSWETFGKIITTGIGIVAGLLAFVKYIDQREMELAARNYEAAQKVREFNIQIYSQSTNPGQGTRVLLNEATDLVSTIATLDSLETPTGVIATDRFERLYHGQLVLYEGPAVANAMINFRDAVLKWQRTKTRPTELLPEERSNTDEPLKLSKQNSDFMKQLALALSRACKAELKELNRAVLDNEEGK